MTEQKKKYAVRFHQRNKTFGIMRLTLFVLIRISSSIEYLATHSPASLTCTWKVSGQKKILVGSLQAEVAVFYPGFCNVTVAPTPAILLLTPSN